MYLYLSMLYSQTTVSIYEPIIPYHPTTCNVQTGIYNYINLFMTYPYPYVRLQSGRVPDVSIKHIHVTHALAKFEFIVRHTRTRQANARSIARPRKLAQSFLLRRCTTHYNRHDFLILLFLFLFYRINNNKKNKCSDTRLK